MAGSTQWFSAIILPPAEKHMRCSPLVPPAKSYKYLFSLSFSNTVTTLLHFYWIQSRVVTLLYTVPAYTTVRWEDVAGGVAISIASGYSQAYSLSINSLPCLVLPTFWIDSSASAAETLPLWSAVSRRGSVWYKWWRIWLSQGRKGKF